MKTKTFFTGAFFVLLSVLPVTVPSAHALEAHETIRGLFNTTRDVVVKCLECHRQNATDVLLSSHWTWKRSRLVNGRQMMYGKKDSLAAFAVDVTSNPARCLRCHISSTPGIEILEGGAEADVDCLVCHDTTGRYVRSGEQPGLGQADYEIIARNVGRPTPRNCTSCHFADCGLTEYSRSDAREKRKAHFSRGDVHLNGEAAAFACQACHRGNSGHSSTGEAFPAPEPDAAGGGCTSCHTGSPHRIDRLNRHAETVSCRTCHIPAYAAETPAMVGWNWFLTGRISPVFQSISGGATFLQDSSGFTLSKMIHPVYMWDQGSDQVYTRGQRIIPQELTYLQRPTARSPKSKIVPFKIQYGTQLYDTKYRYLISPLLSTAGKELFPGSDWDAVAREGMKAIVLPYSGEYGVAPTAAFRRLNHGVAPARDALDCTDCHGSGGRMNWQALGYDEDPWSGEQAGMAEAEPLQGIILREETEPVPPVQELKITPLE